MPILDSEETITCPYNPSHQILPKRIQIHLVKCRKNHPNSDVEICPFNSSHHVPKSEWLFHMSTCESRKFDEMARYSNASSFKANNKYMVVASSGLPKPDNNARFEVVEEDWEKEATIKKSYDPSEKASKVPVLRNLQGATPSQRKAFRASEKVRIGALHDGLVVDDTETKKVANKENISKSDFVGKENKVEPLRRPITGNKGQAAVYNAPSRQGSVKSAHIGRGRAARAPYQTMGKTWNVEFQQENDPDNGSTDNVGGDKSSTMLVESFGSLKSNDQAPEEVNNNPCLNNVNNQMKSLQIGKGIGQPVLLRKK